MSVQDTVVLRGRAGSDVSLYTPEEEGKRTFARFRMAVPRARRRDDGTWEETEAQWYTIRAWGALADNAYLSIRRGVPLVVVGRPTSQAWIGKDGVLRSEVAINAQTMGPDLAMGATLFRRHMNPNRRGTGADADGAADVRAEGGAGVDAADVDGAGVDGDVDQEVNGRAGADLGEEIPESPDDVGVNGGVDGAEETVADLTATEFDGAGASGARLLEEKDEEELLGDLEPASGF